MKKGLAQEGSQAPCTKWVWALLAAVLLFIWGNSLLPPSWSWRVSGVVQEAVEQVLPVEQADGLIGQVKGFTVRKLAHMSEFALLGALLALLTCAHSRRDRVALMLLLGLLAALLDETIQKFTGRTSSVLDVWLDFSGVVLGLLLARLFFLLRCRRRGGSGRPSLRES